jgi:hypothetical protein
MAKLDANWIKNRVGDELGLAEHDLSTMYGVPNVDQHLTTLGSDSNAVYERVLSDVDAVRVGYRQFQVSDDQIGEIRALLSTYKFHPLVSVPMADGSVGWKLSGDDAQWVAFRASDVVGLDFDQGEILRLRLHRAVIWPDAATPEVNGAFRDRIADVTFYLVELSGVL